MFSIRNITMNRSLIFNVGIIVGFQKTFKWFHIWYHYSMRKFNYPISIRPLDESEGGGYLAEFPDLPGCMADGDTVEEAIHEAQDALESWIKMAIKSGDPVPKPSTQQNYSGQWRLRVPKSLHAALAARAIQEGVSLNLLAATLLAQGLGRKLMRHRRKINR